MDRRRDGWLVPPCHQDGSVAPSINAADTLAYLTVRHRYRINRDTRSLTSVGVGVGEGNWAATWRGAEITGLSVRC